MHYLEDLLRTKGHAVVALAEGAGQDLMRRELRLGEDVSPLETDASGNVILLDVGVWMKRKIKARDSSDIGGSSSSHFRSSFMRRYFFFSATLLVVCADAMIQHCSRGGAGLLLLSHSTPFVWPRSTFERRAGSRT